MPPARAPAHGGSHLRIKDAGAPRRTITGAALALAAAVALALPATGVAGIAALQDDVLTIAPLVPDPEPDRHGQGDQGQGRPAFDILWSFVAPDPAREPDQPGRPGLQLEPDRPDHEAA